MSYTPQQLRDEAENEMEYFPWSGPQARAAKDRAHADALEALAAANRQLDDCEHGYATLKADLAAANAKLTAKPDVAGLVERLQKQSVCIYIAAEPECAKDVSDGLRKAADALLSLSAQLQDAEDGVAHYKMESTRLSAQFAEKEASYTRLQSEYANSIDAWSAGLKEKEAECEGLQQDAERWRQWSKDFTFYDTEVAGQHYVPSLSSVSKRIWYHACNDTDHNTVTEYVDAAIAAREKP